MSAKANSCPIYHGSIARLTGDRYGHTRFPLGWTVVTITHSTSA